jgi:hypothetical protein
LLRAANEAKRVHQEARKEFDAIEGLKAVCELFFFAIHLLANTLPASYQHVEQPSSTLATVPVRHICPSARDFQLPPQRAQVSWHTQHRP